VPVPDSADCDNHNTLMSESRVAVTIQDVAARAGVSAMTVSRVINHQPRVAAATRARVLQAIDELGYVPNALARGLLQGRTRTIALIVSDISNPFFTQIARGVEDVAHRSGYAVILGNSDESTDKERVYINAMLSNRVDGLLIAPAGRESAKTLDLLSRRGTKFVLIDRELEGIGVDTVVGDSIGGARTLTEHLIQLGHRRIGLVAGPQGVSTARDRLQGYEAALRSHGIEPDRCLVVESDYKRQGGKQAAMQLLALPLDQRPTAVVASNNFMGVASKRHARHAWTCRTTSRWSVSTTSSLPLRLIPS
jgi:LacI family transcriptional regulator